MSNNGIYLTTAPTTATFIQKLWNSKQGIKAGFMATALRTAIKKKKDLYFIKQLVEKGNFRPVIDRSYPMEEIVEAHKYVETGRKKGDVIIKIQ